jgi:phage terminase small subunit
MTKERKLTPKERAFVLAYVGRAAGNGSAAASLAGYAKKSSHVTASKLLRKPNIAAAIEKLVRSRESEELASARDRDLILSKIARSTAYKPVTRILAIRELNKVEGRHVNRHEISGRITLEDAMQASRELKP